MQRRGDCGTIPPRSRASCSKLALRSGGSPRPSLLAKPCAHLSVQDSAQRPELPVFGAIATMLERILIAARSAGTSRAAMHAAALLARYRGGTAVPAASGFRSATRALAHRGRVSRMIARHQPTGSMLLSMACFAPPAKAPPGHCDEGDPHRVSPANPERASTVHGVEPCKFMIFRGQPLVITHYRLPCSVRRGSPGSSPRRSRLTGGFDFIALPVEKPRRDPDI